MQCTTGKNCCLTKIVTIFICKIFWDFFFLFCAACTRKKDCEIQFHAFILTYTINGSGTIVTWIFNILYYVLSQINCIRQTKKKSRILEPVLSIVQWKLLFGIVRNALFVFFISSAWLDEACIRILRHILSKYSTYYLYGPII